MIAEPQIVSLFSGYGGLEMGIQSVVGGEVLVHVEFDDAPSRILAYHHPRVPNLGDITAIDWSAFLDEHPELGDLFGSYRPGLIVCGGFPCQDVSLAGLRRGLKDGTRSGLWSEFARAIDELRPELVVIENVRGLLSAEADRGLESDPEDLGDGASGPVLRALGAVLGDLADLGYDARWIGVRAADAGAPHGRFRVFIVAYPDSLGRRPILSDVRSRESDAYGRTAQDADVATCGEWRITAPGEAEGGRPWADAGRRGGASAPDAGRHGLGGHTQLDSSSIESGLEAPLGEHPDRRTTADTHDGESVREHGEQPRRVAAAGRGAGPAADAERVAVQRLGDAGSMAGAARLPRVEAGEPDSLGQAASHRGSRDWGPYAAAVERWEHATGRIAPAPTRADGRDGQHRLSPPFVEWMMGLPMGWLTSPEVGLSRAQQLKALGNGVVPQQAALAVATLLEAS